MSEVPVRQKASLLLILSLCLNVALLGVVGVMLWRSNEQALEPRAPKVGLSAQMLMRLVPAEKVRIEAILTEHRPRLRELRNDAMRARVESFRILTEPNFDSTAFANALAQVQTADAALEAETMTITSDSVAALTPQERALVAGKVQKPDRASLKHFFRGH
jgi:uncharacterized membrane protein